MTAQATTREVFCVTEHEHRDRAAADGILAGRFTVAGETRELGADVRWLDAPLPRDEEWRIEWVKFAWGLDLAHAAAQTGEPAYRAAWERLVGSWIDQVPSDHDAAEVTARRILNWIYARQRFAAVPEDLDAALRASLAAQVAHVRWHLAPARNHRTLELYALFVAALAVPELDRDDLLGFAVSALDHNLASDFRPDGVHCEASTHYHLIALRSFVGMRENARRFSLALPPGFDERLARACAFAMHCTRPDGTIPALSDSDTGDYRPLLALASDLLDDDALRHVASHGATGSPPACRGATFLDGGYFVQRSGWADDRERFLVFDCGPLGDGGHGHYDLLGVEACGGGRVLLADPGRGTYSEAPPNLRRWFKGTAAHNTVCVDGLDQTPYRRGRPEGAVAEGRFLGRGTADGLDVMAGAAHSPCYDAVHERRIAFVDGAYWVVEDRLHGDGLHRFDLRLHLSPEAMGATAVDGTRVLAPGLVLVVLGADEIRVEPGWVAPAYGRLLDAPVISATVAEASHARLATLVFPCEPGTPPPRMRRVGPGFLVEHRDVRDAIGFTDTGCVWRRTRGASGRTVQRSVRLEPEAAGW